jgi:hypothetical protein
MIQRASALPAEQVDYCRYSEVVWPSFDADSERVWGTIGEIKRNSDP